MKQPLSSKNSTIVRLPFPAILLRKPLEWAPFLRRPILTRLFLSPIVRARSSGAAAGAVIGNIRIGGVRILVRARGSGPPVLLVHGWQGSSRHFSSLRERLVNAGCTAVSFDMPAHGETSGTMTSLPEFVEAILGVARLIGPIHGVVAHSLGATATSLSFDRGFRPQTAALIAPMISFDFALDEFSRVLGLSDELREARADGTERRVGISRAEANLLSLRDPGLPVLIAHDDDDERTPLENSRLLERLWPSARLMTTNGLSHRRILDDDGVGRSVVELLRAAPRPRATPLDFPCAPEMRLN